MVYDGYFSGVPLFSSKPVNRIMVLPFSEVPAVWAMEPNYIDFYPHDPTPIY
jgi:hypothetical protein